MYFHVDANDDPGFIAIASRILERSIALYQPAEIYATHIDNWFDAKWLDFSGNALGAIGVWNKNTSIPPFHPNRMVFQWHLRRDGPSKSYSVAPLALHRIQMSSENLKLNRSVVKNFDSAVLFWYSGDTAKTRRGSLMLYRVADGEVASWYASYHCAPEWKVLHTMQISKAEVAHLQKETSNKSLEPTAGRSDA